VLALALVAGCGGSASAPEAPGCALPAGDPFCSMNQAFLEAYGRERSAIVAQLSPVILQLGDTLVLLRNGTRSEGVAVTSRYHEYKSIAHTSLALFALLRSRVDTPLDQAALQELQAYRALVAQGRASLAGRGLPAAALELHGRILDRSLALLDDVVAARGIARAALLDFARQQAPDVLLSAKMAARDQIETTDRQISEWKRQMSPDELARLRVVVSVGHMPGRGNIGLQYFSATLGEHYEGQLEVEDINDRVRVIAQESLSESEGLKLLGTHLLDGEVGVAFFDDFARMHRDLLADAGEEILASLPGRREASAPSAAAASSR